MLSPTALRLGPSTSPVSLPLFGGRDTKGKRTLARLILVLSAWAIAPTVGSRFLLFPEPELPLCPHTSACCKPKAALSLTREGHMPGQAPVAKAHPALPLSACSCLERQQPAKVLTEDTQTRLSWRTSAVTRAM